MNPPRPPGEPPADHLRATTRTKTPSSRQSGTRRSVIHEKLLGTIRRASATGGTIPFAGVTPDSKLRLAEEVIAEVEGTSAPRKHTPEQLREEVAPAPVASQSPGATAPVALVPVALVQGDKDVVGGDHEPSPSPSHPAFAETNAAVRAALQRIDVSKKVEKAAVAFTDEVEKADVKEEERSSIIIDSWGFEFLRTSRKGDDVL